MRDYVVALDAATGDVVGVWRGERFRRSYNDAKVHQYKIAMATNDAEAITRAQSIHAQLKRLS